jgi:hypothetical protein
MSKRQTKYRALSVGLPSKAARSASRPSVTPLTQGRESGPKGLPSEAGVMNEQILRSIYYDPKFGFKVVQDLLFKAREAGAEDLKQGEVKKWLETQDTYTVHKPIQTKFK